LQQSHNGFQKTVGSEQDFYQDDKIKYAIKIYNKYDDKRAEILENARRKIKFIPIEDVDQIILPQ
jgi:dissimilatory sulfite reductase (desulfoviridin) alpha/beta subunit